MINAVFILLKQSKNESSEHSPLERKNITKDLSESTKEQRKSHEEGKFYSFKADAFPSM